MRLRFSTRPTDKNTITPATREAVLQPMDLQIVTFKKRSLQHHHRHRAWSDVSAGKMVRKRARQPRRFVLTLSDCAHPAV